MRNNNQKLDNYGFVSWDEKSEENSETNVKSNEAKSIGKSKWWKQLFKKHEKSLEKDYNARKILKKSKTNKKQNSKKEISSQDKTCSEKNVNVVNCCNFEDLDTKNHTRKSNRCFSEKVLAGNGFQEKRGNFSRLSKNSKECLLLDKNFKGAVKMRGDILKQSQQRKVLVHIRTK